MSNPKADQGNRCIVDQGINHVETPVQIRDLQGERISADRKKIGCEQSLCEPLKLDDEHQKNQFSDTFTEFRMPSADPVTINHAPSQLA
jgi:hypothetical protein